DRPRQPAALARVEDDPLEHQAAGSDVVMLQVRAHRRPVVEVRRGLEVRAAKSVAASRERALDYRAQTLDEVADDRACDLAQLLLDLRLRASVEREQHLQQIPIRLKRVECLRVRQEIREAVAIERVGLQHLEDRLREEASRLTDPVHRLNLRRIEAARPLAAPQPAPLIRPRVEIIEHAIDLGVASVEAAEMRARVAAEREAPTLRGGPAHCDPPSSSGSRPSASSDSRSRLSIARPRSRSRSENACRAPVKSAVSPPCKRASFSASRSVSRGFSAENA